MTQEHEYLRLHVPGEPVPKGWKVVEVPGEGTYQIEEPLATEIETKVRKGYLSEAYALLFWFDAREVLRPPPEGTRGN